MPSHARSVRTSALHACVAVTMFFAVSPFFACKSNERVPSEPPPAPTAEPAPAPPPSARPSLPPTHFRIDTRPSLVTLSLATPEEVHTGRATLVGGDFTIAPEDLRRSHGTVSIDLESFRVTAGPKRVEDKRQTDRVLEWLELRGRVEPARKERYRFATLALRRFELSGSERLDDRPLAPGDGGGEERVVRATAHGELGLHAVNVPLRAEVLLVFGAGPELKKVELRTLEPIRTALEDHGIVGGPPGARGREAGPAAGRLVIELELVAPSAPAPEPAPSATSTEP